MQEHFMKEWLKVQPPLGFTYGKIDFEDFFDEWEMEHRTTDTPSYTNHVVSYKDPLTKLKVVLDYKAYKQYPAIEWVAHFVNDGSDNSPIIGNILPMQISWESPTIDPAFLHYSNGSAYSATDFIPLKLELKHWEKETLNSLGGRSSDGFLPFFNLQTGNIGMLTALGWTGQWKFSLVKNQPEGATKYEIFLEAGMEKTHLTLYPGEQIRTPRMLTLFWTGDRIDAHNQWRRLILEHYSPKVNGKRPHAPLSYPTWGSVTTKNHKMFLKAIQEQNLSYEYYWTDAGWYIPDEVKNYPEITAEWGKHVGRWITNNVLYPNGIEELSAEIHKIGMKFLLWFEPERAKVGSELPTKYPNYFLKRTVTNDNLMLDLGNPEACTFLTNFISDFIEKFGIDCYRQDCNLDPLDFWQRKDTPDRVGMAEIKHVTGLYEFWDELLKRHPGLLIDNCASGGRRIDLETISRSIPLWRSDLQCFDGYDITGSQIQTYGLNMWVPLNSCGTRFNPGDTYKLRSAFSSGMVFHHIPQDEPFDENYPWDWHRKMIQDFKRAREFYEGDFYPLTECSTSHKDWLAYQYHRPDLNAGMIVAFRRDESPFTQACFKLRGLTTPNYSFEDADSGEKIQFSKEEIEERGFELTLPNQPESKLIFYTVNEKRNR